MNTQQPEKRIKIQDPLSNLDVHSVFKTIQGEGPFTGTPCVFIRLAGCNLQCPKCDTEYTEGRQQIHIMELFKQVQEISVKDMYGRSLVVITGGEPFRQQLTGLITLLIRNDFYVQIETNGTLPVSPHIFYNPYTDQRTGCYVVCSPKTGTIHGSVEQVMCAVKYVMGEDDCDYSVGLPKSALKHPCHPHLYRVPKTLHYKPVVYLQPRDDKNETINELNLNVCIDSCLKHGYTLQLQTHKLIGVE